MISPAVRTRVEEADERATLPVDRSHITALRLVAEDAGVRQVVPLCRPAVLLTDNVIGFAAVEGVFLSDQAILTDPFGPCRHEAAQLRTDVGAGHAGHPAARCWRARALARRITCSTCR